MDGQSELTTKYYYVDEKINNADYMVYFNKTKRYELIEDKIFENSTVIFENDAGGIIKYNK